jgi:hypothetical protein
MQCACQLLGAVISITYDCGVQSVTRFVAYFVSHLGQVLGFIRVGCESFFSQPLTGKGKLENIATLAIIVLLVWAHSLLYNPGQDVREEVRLVVIGEASEEREFDLLGIFQHVWHLAFS